MVGRSRGAGGRLREFGPRVLSAIGRQEWLDRPSYRLEHLLSIGYNALGGAASVAFAITGTTDRQHTHEENRRVGLVHGLVNLTATALYAQSWWDRRHCGHGRGIALTAPGYAITLGGSYLGGALAFESGIGIDQSGERLRTTEWTPVLPASSVNGKPVRVEVDGVGLVVCQTKPGEVSAFGEFCPHLAAPMADGWVDRGRVVCPWHGSWFDAQSGEVLRGPAAAPLPCHQARLVEGMVEVRAQEVAK
jgi:nitrite reductase/ring-hydroxylating ferredoxin subunit